MKKTVLPESVGQLRRVFGLFGYLLVVWGCYRLIFKLPDSIEELILKPIFWLLPTFWLVLVIEKRNLFSIGWRVKNFFPGLYWGIGLGMLFSIEGLLGNFLKYGQASFSLIAMSTPVFLGALGISIVTAISEETVFRGYILTRLNESLRSNFAAILVTSLLFVGIHFPVTMFVLRYDLFQIVSYFFLLFLFSVGSSWIFLRLGTIIPSIAIHSFWGWAILLFR